MGQTSHQLSPRRDWGLAGHASPRPQPETWGISTKKIVVSKHHEMDVSENHGTSKSSILIGFSVINHPFGVPLFLETPRW